MIYDMFIKHLFNVKDNTKWFKMDLRVKKLNAKKFLRLFNLTHLCTNFVLVVVPNKNSGSRDHCGSFFSNGSRLHRRLRFDMQASLRLRI